MKNYYEILEVDVKASKEIIEKAYKILAKRYHPDTQSEDKKKWAEEKFKEINEAYEVLSNEDSRKNYDVELEYDKDSAIKAICAKNEHLQHLVEELQNELNKLRNHTNYESQNNMYSTVNSHYNDASEFKEPFENAGASYSDNFNRTFYTKPQEEYVYYKRVPYTRNKLKDLLAFVITIVCIIVFRIFALENTFY